MAHAIVVIGSSLGGLQALKTILSALPRSFPLPVVIAQHREEGPEDTLTGLLKGASARPVVEPEDKQAVDPGCVYVAPAGYHLLIECGLQIADCGIGNGKSELRNPKSEMERSAMHFALSTDAPVSHSRPSVDVLFESAADTFGERAIGVILTGANEDGARGLAAIKDRGGLAVVQDPETAEARAMPEAAMAAVPEATVLPLGEIGAFLVERCG